MSAAVHHVARFGEHERGRFIGTAATEAEAKAFFGEVYHLDFYDAEDGPGVHGYEADGLGVWIIDGLTADERGRA